MNYAVLATMGNWGVQCIVLLAPGGRDKYGSPSATGMWWPGCSDSTVRGPIQSQYDNYVTGLGGSMPPGWSSKDVESMLDVLDHATGPTSRGAYKALLGKPHLFVWGGARRVFYNLAHEVPPSIPRIAELAKRCYDPDFQLLRTAEIGFPIRASSMMDVMPGEEMVDDYNPSVGSVDRAMQSSRDCLELAAQYTRLIDAIMIEGGVRWTARSGKIARREIEGGWRTIRAMMKKTYGSRNGEPITEPARRWCNDGSFNLPNLVGWMDGLEVVSKWS